MIEGNKFLINRLFDGVLPAVVLLGVLLGGIVLRKIIFIRLSRLAKNTASHIDDIIIEAIKTPFIIWSLMLGIYLALRITSLSPDIVRLSGKTLLVLGIASVTLVLANICLKTICLYSQRIDSALPVTSLTQNISRIVIFGVGALIILNVMGISVTPVLATLGVGGLAVALALQDTLANIFAGFYTIVSKQVRLGDYIKLDSGEEGYVTDINWRTTRIKMLPNNEILVPNDKLTKAIITNYCLPDKQMAVLVNLGVHYSSDLEKVERLTCEVAKKVMKEVNGGVPNFEPFIRYHTFGESSIDFTVILRAGEFVDQYLIKHEFVKKLHKRYNEEGIVIPFPIRAINYSQEK